MKFRTLTLKQAEAKHPGCYLELKMRTASDGIPEHEALPVAAMPAIFVCSDKQGMKPAARRSIGSMRDSLY